MQIKAEMSRAVSQFRVISTLPPRKLQKILVLRISRYWGLGVEEKASVSYNKIKRSENMRAISSP